MWFCSLTKTVQWADVYLYRSVLLFIRSEGCTIVVDHSQSKNWQFALRQMRVPIMFVTAVVLLAALWMALQRSGWEIPIFGGVSPAQHGAVMVAGFLGKLICLERVVALQRPWAYAVPVVMCAGAIVLLTGISPTVGRTVLVIGAMGFVLLCLLMYKLHPTLDVAIMANGAVCLFFGNSLWLLNMPMHNSVPWWIGFLVLTIAGERLELARMLRLSVGKRVAFVFAISVFLAGLATTLVSFETGVQIAGLGLVALAAWLMLFDVARRTVDQIGLPRYIAVCLLTGYIWLLVGGLLWLIFAPYFVGGVYYDAMLHSIFLGFVFSMIFGHAPIIMPAILNVPVVYTPRYYAHLALLHTALLVRIVGDLSVSPLIQRWGSTFNVIAILLFIVSSAIAVRSVLSIKQRLINSQ